MTRSSEPRSPWPKPVMLICVVLVVAACIFGVVSSCSGDYPPDATGSEWR